MAVSCIILGFPYEDIKEFIESNSWTENQKAFIDIHTFDSVNEKGEVGKYFGIILDSWNGFKEGIDVKPSTIAYVSRGFVERVENVLGYEVLSLFKIIGISLL